MALAAINAQGFTDELVPVDFYTVVGNAALYVFVKNDDGIDHTYRVFRDNGVDNQEVGYVQAGAGGGGTIGGGKLTGTVGDVFSIVVDEANASADSVYTVNGLDIS